MDITNYEWLDEYCTSKRGACKDIKAEWNNATRYMVGEKMFVLKGVDKQGRRIVTVKCESSFGHMLREQHEDIIAGYYMNKEHWNSVYLEGRVPDEVLKQMIDMSYELVFKSLSKRKQREILGEDL